ncbi:MAG: amidase [Gemmatimonadales bacterium]|nr:amidase [Gemmatimonadales bacterium]
MDDLELSQASVSELSVMLAAKKVSPVELVRSILVGIERSQATLNAFITVCAESALAQARESEAEIMRGALRGPLHGIPFSVKDTIATSGVRTTYGSLIFADNVPDRDAVAVERVRRAGGILVGKTTTPEFAFLGMTEAPLFGRTANAWNPGRTCGGSSGGAAAAVGAGLGPVAIATDAGGSARIPAACNGVVGLKPSLGRVPHDWADDAFGNVQYVSPIGRTVLDAAFLLEAMAGPHPSDPNTLYRDTESYSQLASRGGNLGGLRFIWKPLLGNELLAADVRAACEATLHLIEGLGGDVSESNEPFENQEALISKVNASARLAQYGHHLASHREQMCPKLVRQLEQVSHLTAQELWTGVFERTRLFHRVQGWFEKADFVVTPTLARTALPIDQDFFAPIEIDGKVADTPRRAWYPYTIPFNATGHPAISLPCGWDRDGLPIGLQLVARPGADAELLRVSALIEQAARATRRPLPPPPDRSTAGH